MVATRERNHISIDILSRFLSGGYLVGLRIVTNLFAAAICFVTVFYALELVQYEFEDETEAFASVPVWVCQSIIPFAFGVMGVRFLLSLWPRSD
jgi:TRAP-type C4-dicarboxylate transport system permease small subunit